ncbi:MAG: acetoin:2,6-dichlorophenolindophenol oxidoreductase subunit beta [Gaiellales bacterium]|jgi:pyruvate dehydrogenase E1 component beta subunit|nr:acetoin:2,6-dichlorophenolindophenol oxidoreductase subunit beta [Gaiellales bacterium]
MSTLTEVRELTFAQAINEALTEEFERDERVILIGEDVGRAGGVYKISEGLYDRFGPERVIDSPISEAGITGVALGAAMTGLRPVVELMFGDFTTLAMDQIVNQAAKVRYMSGGALAAPLVVRTTLGAGRSLGAQHSQSLHAWFAHVPGLKVLMPGSPEDAKGLLKAAIRSDDPVVYFEDKAAYRERGPVPSGDVVTPIGVARICREGSDVTLVAISSMVTVALAAAHELEGHGISAEVVDPRSLTPLDEATLLASVAKTSRCIVIDEGHGRFGASAELAAVIARGAFFHLNAPVERIAASDVPVPFNPRLEAATIPDAERVVASARAMVGR